LHLLVTRPEPDASALAARLEALGHRVSLAPLIDIDLAPIPAADLAEADSLIATSRNALRALVASEAADAARGKRLFVVGPGSRALAERKGFRHVVAGPSSAEALVPVILAATAATPDAPLLYLAGDAQAIDLAGALAAARRSICTRVVYRQVPRTTLPSAVARDLGAGAVDGVLLYSPRTAGIYADLVATGIERQAIANTVHFCLSVAVAAPLAPLAVATAIAVQPDSEEMLALVSRVAAVSAPRT
jgi:uroporphyrinogen-III synthase